MISLKTPMEGPPLSPDLSPLDFFLWGYLKDRVYEPAPKDINELKRAIKREMRKIQVDVCMSVIRNFRERVDLVVRQNGRHLEHIM